MIQTGENYVHGTAAQKLEYNVYEENKVLKAKRNQRNNNKAKLKTVAYILVVFSMCLVLMLRYAQIIELNYKINLQNNQYNTLRNENSRLKVAIDNEMDLQKVREIAENKLGMQKPDKFQVVYIKVQKNDFTEITDEHKAFDNSNENTLAVLMNKVGKLVSFLE